MLRPGPKLFAENADTSISADRITPRELEVLEMIAMGFCNKEIADQLNVSTNTVITHRKHLIAKFDARNTAHMVKMACNVFAFD